MNQSVSCSTLLKKARAHAARHLPPDQHFYAGFIIGQFEKVYLETCPAAMFAIPAENDELRSFAVALALDYGLTVHWPRIECNNEVWVCRRDTPSRVSRILDLMEAQARLMNEGKTEAAHSIRAALCGIPAHRLDPWWSPQHTGPVPME